jgi:hypothetical protein
VLAAFAPGGSSLAAWPALAGALAGAVCAATSARAVRVAAVLAAGAGAVVVLAPTVALFFPALGLATGAAPAFVATMLVAALLPALEWLFPDPDGQRARPAAVLVPLVAAVVAVVCKVAGLRTDRFDAEHPVPSQLAYALDTDDGRAWWVSTEQDPGDYAGRYVDRRGELPARFPYLAGTEVSLGAAEIADLPAPAVTTVSDAVVGGRRELTVQVTPRRPGVRLLALDVTTEGGTVTGARVAGRGVPEDALGKDRFWVTSHAPPPDGVQATLTIVGDGPVSLRAIDGSDGLTGLPGHHPRPAGIDVAGTHSSDLVLVSATTPLG